MTQFFLPTAVSADIKQDSNHWAMCLGEGPDDFMTWENPLHQDAEGNLFIFRTLWVSQAWVDFAKQQPQRPVWDTDNTVNMAGAKRAFDALTFWHPDDETDPPTAEVGGIVCLQGLSGEQALAALGLTLVPQDDEI